MTDFDDILCKDIQKLQKQSKTIKHERALTRLDKRTVMLAEERWNEILRLLDAQKTVTVPELTEKLHTSESTIRRDLVQLDQMKRLVKVHGGATSIEVRYELHDQAVSEKKLMNTEAKEKIGTYAATLIGDGDFVYIDAGSTTSALVQALGHTDAVFVTNSIEHARVLLTKGSKVMLPAGELKATTEVLVGAQAVESLRNFHFTIGFWGTNGVSDKTGFTTPETEEAMVKRVSMEQTKKCFVLADSSKFSTVSPITFAAFDAAHIITDRIADKRYKPYHTITEVGNE